MWKYSKETRKWLQLKYLKARNIQRKFIFGNIQNVEIFKGGTEVAAAEIFKGKKYSKKIYIWKYSKCGNIQRRQGSGCS